MCRYITQMETYEADNSYANERSCQLIVLPDILMIRRTVTYTTDTALDQSFRVERTHKCRGFTCDDQNQIIAGNVIVKLSDVG